jgi:hypothetical protein
LQLFENSSSITSNHASSCIYSSHIMGAQGCCPKKYSPNFVEPSSPPASLLLLATAQVLNIIKFRSYFFFFYLVKNYPAPVFSSPSFLRFNISGYIFQGLETTLLRVATQSNMGSLKQGTQWVAC